MRFSTREDIDAPIDAAFAATADLDYLERQVLRRGIELVRTDALEAPAPGMGWRAELPIRSELREVRCALEAWSPPQSLLFRAFSGGLESELLAEFTALSRRTTRIRVVMELRASGFRDRMLLNALRLSRARLAERFSGIVAGMARDAERRAGG